MVTAIQSLAGDHSCCVTGSSPLVTMRGYPPSAGTIHTCGDPLMLEMKLTHLPSGENLGAAALPTRAIRATAAATSAGLEDGEFWLMLWPITAKPRQLRATTVKTR